MTNSAGTVTLVLDANSVKMLRELQKAQTRTKATATNMADDFKRAFTRIAQASAVAATAIAGSAVAIYKTQSQVLDSLGKTSDMLGVQQERLQALQYAGDLAGVSTDSLTNNLRQLQRRLGEIARNGGGSEDALEAIGISIKDIINLPADQQLEAISRAMANVGNSAVKASIANDLFGRSGGEMLAMMTSLQNDGLNPFVETVDALGLSLSRVDTARIERANDALFTAKQAFTGVFQRLAVNMSDFVYNYAVAFTDMATNSDMLGDRVDEMFHKILMGSINIFESIGTALSPIMSIMKSLWDSFMQLPQFARELGIVGALLFGRAGLAGVIAITAATNALQSAVGYAASQMPDSDSFAGSQLDRLSKLLSGETQFSPMEEVAGLFTPDYENNVRDQASFLRQSVDRVIAERERFVAAYSDPVINDLLDAPVEVFEAVEESVKSSMTIAIQEVTLFEKLATSAAQNIQSSFADFLFNPFENGLRGMAQGFVDAIRRMVAEAASAKIIGMIIGGLANASNPFAAAVGTALGGTAFVGPMPSRDSGGRGAAGQPYMIGKRAQPEIFIPDTAGTFIPNADTLGGSSFNITIDARDPGAEGRIRNMIQQELMPQIIEAAKGNTIAAMRRPRFA